MIDWDEYEVGEWRRLLSSPPFYKPLEDGGYAIIRVKPRDSMMGYVLEVWHTPVVDDEFREKGEMVEHIVAIDDADLRREIEEYTKSGGV